MPNILVVDSGKAPTHASGIGAAGTSNRREQNRCYSAYIAATLVGGCWSGNSGEVGTQYCNKELARLVQVGPRPTTELAGPALTIIGNDHHIYYACLREDLVFGRSGGHVLGLGIGIELGGAGILILAVKESGCLWYMGMYSNAVSTKVILGRIPEAGLGTAGCYSRNAGTLAMILGGIYWKKFHVPISLTVSSFS